MGDGQPTGIRLSEVHAGRELESLQCGKFDSAANIEVEDWGMSGKRSAI